MTDEKLTRAYAAAAAILGVDPSAVAIRVRAPIGRPQTVTDEQIVRACAEAGSCRGAARLLGVAVSRLSQRARDLGCSPKSRVVTDG